MVMYANEVETKEKEKLHEIKKLLQHIHGWLTLVKLITAACSFRSQARNHRKCIIKKCNPYYSHLTGIICMQFTSLLITRLNQCIEIFSGLNFALHSILNGFFLGCENIPLTCSVCLFFVYRYSFTFYVLWKEL